MIVTNGATVTDAPRLWVADHGLALSAGRLGGDQENGSRRAEGGTWALVAAFLLGLGIRLQVQLIGFMPLSEIAVLLAFPFLLPRYTARGAMRCTKLLIPLGLVWLGFTIGTDVYRITEPSLAARGIARVVVMLACIPFAVVFFSRDTYRRLVAFTVGTIPSIVLSAFVLRGGVHFGRELSWGRSEINFETHWVALLVFIAQLVNLLVYHRSRLVAYSASLLAGGVMIYGGSRAAGAAFATGAPLAAFRNLLVSRRRGAAGRGRINGFALVVFVLLVGAVSWGVVEAYSYAASEGMLGVRAQRKFEAQSSTAAGLLFTGRIEFLGGLLAIYDSPVVGHGSWKVDTERYFAKALHWMEIGVDPRFYYLQAYPLIPSHSHFIGAWVENGIGGGLFWGYVAILILRVLYLPLKDESHLRLWVSCAATALLWHIFFSPISSRLETAITLAVFLTQTEAVAASARTLVESSRAGGASLLQATGPRAAVASVS